MRHSSCELLAACLLLACLLLLAACCCLLLLLIAAAACCCLLACCCCCLLLLACCLLLLLLLQLQRGALHIGCVRKLIAAAAGTLRIKCGSLGRIRLDKARGVAACSPRHVRAGGPLSRQFGGDPTEWWASGSITCPPPSIDAALCPWKSPSWWQAAASLAVVAPAGVGPNALSWYVVRHLNPLKQGIYNYSW